MSERSRREENDPRPPVRVVRDFHTNSDVDSSKDALHHTLGTGNNQAASGTHSHDGADSVQLLAGVVIGGSRSGGQALVSVISALTRLGATDETTA